MNDKKIIEINTQEMYSILIESFTQNCNVRFTITGNSMYPIFRHGVDCVELSENQNINKYDVILYKRKNGKFIIHRIVKIKDNVLYLAGDNETEIEYPIYKDQVIATLQGFYRGNKYISCNNIAYKAYSWLWTAILPHRFTAIKLLKAVFKLRRNISGK